MVFSECLWANLIIRRLFLVEYWVPINRFFQKYNILYILTSIDKSFANTNILARHTPAAWPSYAPPAHRSCSRPLLRRVDVVLTIRLRHHVRQHPGEDRVAVMGDRPGPGSAPHLLHRLGEVQHQRPNLVCRAGRPPSRPSPASSPGAGRRRPPRPGVRPPARRFAARPCPQADDRVQDRAVIDHVAVGLHQPGRGGVRSRGNARSRRPRSSPPAGSRDRSGVVVALRP